MIPLLSLPLAHRLGRNPCKQYTGSCCNRKNDKNTCDHPDHISPRHLQKPEIQKYRRIFFQSETCLSDVRTVFRSCIGCHNHLSSSCRCNRPVERTEQISNHHGNVRNRSEYEYCQARQDRNETYSHRILLLDRHCFCQSYDAAHSRYLVEFHCQTGFKKCHFLFWRIILCGSESDTFLFLICSASIIFLPGSYQYLPASHSIQKYLLPSQVPPESD